MLAVKSRWFYGHAPDTEVSTMKRHNDPPSPESRARATVRLRRLTRAASVAAVSATALIGLAVAKDHPGSANATTTKSTTASTTTGSGANSTSSSATSSSSIGTTTPTTTAPTTTTTAPKVTSGGTSR